MILSQNCREWPFFPIEMPVNVKGDGPATVGVDAVKMTYEVWDWSFNTHGSFDFLPDAINLAIELSTKREE